MSKRIELKDIGHIGLGGRYVIDPKTGKNVEVNVNMLFDVFMHELYKKINKPSAVTQPQEPELTSPVKNTSKKKAKKAKT